MSANKEKIKIDHMKDGYRIIQTERTPHIFPYKRNLTDAAISLDVVEYGKKDYSICIYLFADLNIDKGSKLLLKLDNEEIIECEVLVLAIGHSARDTFKMLSSYFTVNIVIDFDNNLDLKDSPVDKGKEVFELLLKDKITIVDVDNDFYEIFGI